MCNKLLISSRNGEEVAGFHGLTFDEGSAINYFFSRWKDTIDNVSYSGQKIQYSSCHFKQEHTSMKLSVYNHTKYTHKYFNH